MAVGEHWSLGCEEKGSTPSISSKINNSTDMAKTNYRGSIVALGVGETASFAPRAAKVSTIRNTAFSVGRDMGRVYTVSAAKGQPIIVSRIR